MAIAAEVLGMALPGSAVVPAVESRRRDLAERTGVRAVELARAGIRPDDMMTPDAFDNAIRVLSATGGSTNEFIHLVAIAGRLGIALGVDRFADIGEQTPQVLGVRPSGPFALARTSTTPVASPLCWRCWSRCWTATASWRTGGRWPKSLPA
jgi:dihydroxy-acid dehydratase